MPCVFVYQIKEPTEAEKLPLSLSYPPGDVSPQEHTHLHPSVLSLFNTHTHTHTHTHSRLNGAQRVDGGLVCFPSDSLFM